MTDLLETSRPRVLLVALCLALWLPGFATMPPGDRDESRFVQATKQMLETGDYVRIMNGTEPRNRKPIGIHWLQVPFAGAARAMGVATVNPVWPYRVPSLLGALVGVLACHAAGVALVGRRAALLGAGMLAASVVVVGEVHIAKTDAALLGATTVAMAVLARAWMGLAVGRGQAALFWAAVGAGVLLKGPITPMVVGLAVLGAGLGGRRWAWLRVLRAGWGVPLMLAVVLPWFVAIGVATGGKFFADAVGGDLGRKLSSGDDAHWGPPGLHLVLLPLLLFPATAALPGAVRMVWRERRVAPVLFLVAWVVPAWFVFEAAPTKLPHYTMPLYPALCLLLARAVEGGALGSWVAGRRTGAALAGVGVALLVTVAAGAGVAFGEWWVGVPGVVAALVVGWFAVRAWDGRRMVLAVGSAALLYLALLGVEAPRLGALWISPRVVAGLPQGARLGSVGFSEPSLMFLAGTGTRWLLADDGAAALAGGEVDVLLVGDRDLVAVRARLAALGVTSRALDDVRGFNASRGRWVVLTPLIQAPGG